MGKIEKPKKLYSDLSTFDEFLEFYEGATKAELRARLRTLGETKKLSTIKDNERRAVKALLY